MTSYPTADTFRWKQKTESEYPTSVTTLNILDQHLRCSSNQSEPRTPVDNNEMCY
jgi:hypothetical protein